jgi:hypothetical protein
LRIKPTGRTTISGTNANVASTICCIRIQTNFHVKPSWIPVRDWIVKSVDIRVHAALKAYWIFGDIPPPRREPVVISAHPQRRAVQVGRDEEDRLPTVGPAGPQGAFSPTMARPAMIGGLWQHQATARAVWRLETARRGTAPAESSAGAACKRAGFGEDGLRRRLKRPARFRPPARRRQRG